MQENIYIGTYTHSMSGEETTGSGGIFHYRIHRESGEMTLQSVVPGERNPGFLSVGKHTLYSANEHFGSGQVSTYRIDAATGGLTCQSTLEFSGESETCFAAPDAEEKLLFAANYGSGSLAACRLGEDGALTGEFHLYRHSGSSVNPRRQSAPHVHSVNPDFSGERLIAADLGTDRLHCYRIEHETGELSADPAQPTVSVAPGEGPRHIAFHPNGKTMYLSSEMGGHVIVFDYDHSTGTMVEKQVVSTLPDGYGGPVSVGHIAVSPDGKCVLAANRRGQNTIVVFRVDPNDGKLCPVQTASCGGELPRHFALCGGGTLLLTANQGSNNVSVFRFDSEEGRIGPLLWQESLPVPMCIAVGKTVNNGIL